MRKRTFFYFVIFTLVVCRLASLLWPDALYALYLIVPLILIGIHDIFQKKHAILRNFPILGHLRYISEKIRPEIQQYFVASDTSEKPFDRETRELVYRRSKGERDTEPFGTERDIYAVGYEWVQHSLSPKPVHEIEPRIKIGGKQCSKPYFASHLNTSAMSYGALSKNAIMALNKGARLGGFYHNTGEGGLSDYHLEHSGDLVWQLGTAYFGCRDNNGSFDPVRFQEKAQNAVVKMIEIKLSQGAKPAHGGILPGTKVTAEIARIRGIEIGRDCISPPAHSAFQNPKGLLLFVQQLRELSGGKPVGFKLCIGFQHEFMSICKAMLATGILPDFITIDGAEGGTGAAPVEYSDYIGMPLEYALVFAHNCLVGIGVRDEVKLIASGKVTSGFDLIAKIAIGADLCNSARGMMFSIGCIQSRKCNTNACPTGVATQDDILASALNVEDKSERCARFHKATVSSFLDILASMGLSSPQELQPHHLYRRISANASLPYDQIYPFLSTGDLLMKDIHPFYKDFWQRASAECF